MWDLLRITHVCFFETFFGESNMRGARARRNNNAGVSKVVLFALVVEGQGGKKEIEKNCLRFRHLGVHSSGKRSRERDWLYAQERGMCVVVQFVPLKCMRRWCVASGLFNSIFASEDAWQPPQAPRDFVCNPAIINVDWCKQFKHGNIFIDEGEWYVFFKHRDHSLKLGLCPVGPGGCSTWKRMQDVSPYSHIQFMMGCDVKTQASTSHVFAFITMVCHVSTIPLWSKESVSLSPMRTTSLMPVYSQEKSVDEDAGVFGFPSLGESTVEAITSHSVFDTNGEYMGCENVARSEHAMRSDVFSMALETEGDACELLCSRIPSYHSELAPYAYIESK